MDWHPFHTSPGGYIPCCVYVQHGTWMTTKNAHLAENASRPFTKPFHHWSKPHEAKPLIVCRFACMFKQISRYWWCQIIGWGVNIAISIFFVYTFGKMDNAYFISLLLTCLGKHHPLYAFLHFLPESARKPLKTQILYFIIMTVLFAVLFGFLSETMDSLIGYNPERLQRFNRGAGFPRQL